jgi:hypothetical protein
MKNLALLLLFLTSNALAQQWPQKPVSLIGFRLVDFFARKLVRRDRIDAAHAGANIAISNAFDLQRVQAAEIGDLIKRHRRIIDQPDGGCDRH